MKEIQKIYFISDDGMLTSEDQNEVIEYENKLQKQRNKIKPLMDFSCENITLRSYDVYKCDSKENFALLIHQLKEEYPRIEDKEFEKASTIYDPEVIFYGINIIDEGLLRSVQVKKLDKVFMYDLYHDISCRKIDLNASENDFKEFLKVTGLTEDDVKSFYYVWDKYYFGE